MQSRRERGLGFGEGSKVGFPRGREKSQRGSIVNGIPNLESGTETIENEAKSGAGVIKAIPDIPRCDRDRESICIS